MYLKRLEHVLQFGTKGVLIPSQYVGRFSFVLVQRKGI
jgi:putative transposon-encoded protein